VAPVYLRPLLAEARRLGLDTGMLFHGLDFGPDDLDLPGFMVTHHEASRVVRRAIRVFDNPNLGLELGMRSRITDRGVLALGLLASPTLEAAITLSLRYPASAGFLLGVRELRLPQRHELVADTLFDNHDLADFLVDKLFAGLVRQRRQVCELDCSPLLVELMRAPPSNALAHEDHFRCPVRFNCASNRLVFESRWLGLALPMANAMSYKLAVDLLERENERSANGSALSLAVQHEIRKALPQLPTPARVAFMLHLSERSLRRKLALEGLSFRGLLDESRRARAMDLVVNGRRSLAEAATATGFADARSFRRAFNRWAGRPPSALRAEQRAVLDGHTEQRASLNGHAVPRLGARDGDGIDAGD